MSRTVPVRYLSLVTLILSVAAVAVALDKAGGEGPRTGTGEPAKPPAQPAGDQMGASAFPGDVAVRAQSVVADQDPHGLLAA